jgi:DNA polymerase III epsilon subunit-like protein
MSNLPKLQTLQTLQKQSSISFLDGKNVFVFDTETTGLPLGSPSGWGSYWDYRMTDKYQTSRIVSIAWSYINNFSKEKLNTYTGTNTNTNTYTIQHHLRYPEGFTEIPTTHIHGISYNDTLEKGLTLSMILDTYGLGKALLDAEYIIAHNVGFDYHVLMNELHRLEGQIGGQMAEQCMIHLKSLKDNGKLICTGEISTDICKMEFPKRANSSGNIINNTYLGKKRKIYKMPKLCELYRYYYGKDFENAHSADGDVKALLECLRMM